MWSEREARSEVQEEHEKGETQSAGEAMWVVAVPAAIYCTLSVVEALPICWAGTKCLVPIEAKPGSMQ